MNPVIKAAFALALAASFLLAACGGDSSDDGSSGGGDDLFSSSAFGEAVDAVAGEAGEDAPMLQIQINTGGAEFQLRDGEQATGFIYSGGDLSPVEVEVIGAGSLDGQDFPLTDVDPDAIDRIVAGVREVSGIEDIRITVMTLEKQVIDGELKWVVNAEGDGRSGLVFNADPDGSNVTSPTGSAADAAEDAEQGTEAGGGSGSGSGSDSGSETGAGESGGSSGIQDAEALADCIQQAGDDVAAIQACTQ